MRTKTKDMSLYSSRCEYDILHMVESWLDSEFSHEEFSYFNQNLTYRKNRAANKANCLRGRGFLVAINRICVSHNLQTPCLKYRHSGWELVGQFFQRLTGQITNWSKMIVNGLPRNIWQVEVTQKIWQSDGFTNEITFSKKIFVIFSLLHMKIFQV